MRTDRERFRFLNYLTRARAKSFVFMTMDDEQTFNVENVYGNSVEECLDTMMDLVGYDDGQGNTGILHDEEVAADGPGEKGDVLSMQPPAHLARRGSGKRNSTVLRSRVSNGDQQGLIFTGPGGGRRRRS